MFADLGMPEFARGPPGMTLSKQAIRRTGLVMLAPLVVYGLIRPLVSSDALALGIAGAIPISYSLGLAIF